MTIDTYDLSDWPGGHFTRSGSELRREERRNAKRRMRWNGQRFEPDADAFNRLAAEAVQMELFEAEESVESRR